MKIGLYLAKIWTSVSFFDSRCIINI